MPLYRGSRRLILRRNTTAVVSTTTLDPSKMGANVTLSNGNLTATGAGLGVVLSISGHSTGKYYCESHLDTNTMSLGFGNASTNLASFLGGADNNSCAVASNGAVFIAGSSVASLFFTAVQGDTLSMAVDLGNSKVWFRLNGTGWNNDILANQNPATNTGGTSSSTMNAGPYYAGTTTGSAGDAATMNFGATAYTQSVPSGFVNW